MKDLFFVYSLDHKGDVIEKRITDSEHLQRCASSLKHDCGGIVHYNIADMCVDGYLVQGDYLGIL